MLTEEMDNLTKEFKTLAVKFGEDPETYKWEDFFALVNTFNEQWEVTEMKILFFFFRK